MAYDTLAKLFYKDSSSDRYARNQSLASLRRNAESSFKLGLNIGDDELFLAVPREMSQQLEKVLRNERRVSLSFSSLPGVACGSLVRSLVLDEVVCTNEIEGIYSTRKQVNDLLEADEVTGLELSDRRFRELAHLYLGLTDKESSRRPESPGDIRAVYDMVMEGEDLGKNAPDGFLFRKGPVEIIGQGSKSIHEGILPESAIVEAIGRMLSVVDSPDMPEVYSAIAAHFMFEFIHPFYDGNGRTGRYLLALYLSRSLSLLTSLSLSRTIAQNKSAYYKAFKDAELPLNHGEVTPFVMCMLDLIYGAQNSILDDIEEKRSQLDLVDKRLGDIAVDQDLSSVEVNVLYILVQSELFADDLAMPLERLAGYLEKSPRAARSWVKKLENRGLIDLPSKRPPRFVLSPLAWKLLGFEGQIR